ncbi:Uncharacterised protein [Vibrio cholerae]|nr:Uncharacterised protein [Vibrio cholerae]
MPTPNTVCRTFFKPSNAWAYSPLISKITILELGKFSAICLVIKALKLDLPYPVLPSTAKCLLNNLFTPARISTVRVLASLPSLKENFSSSSDMPNTIFKRSLSSGRALAPKGGSIQFSEIKCSLSSVDFMCPIAWQTNCLNGMSDTFIVPNLVACAFSGSTKDISVTRATIRCLPASKAIKSPG